ncbi:MAG: hypothetical protein Phog2KO_16490 [Phototrophicaceae bacterium]
MSENMIWERILEALQDKGRVPNTFTRYLGKQLKFAREEAGLSQSELAKSVYRRRPSISDIENGKMMPDIGTMILLGTALDKSVLYFVHPKYLKSVDRNTELSILEQELLEVFRLLDSEAQKKILNQIRIWVE